ncbi:potassium channel subfamily K member 1 [Trichonephila clavipes]|nr:potassium channel subfamily K member 1 [Trichonephila clavipes]
MAINLFAYLTGKTFVIENKKGLQLTFFTILYVFLVVGVGALAFYTLEKDQDVPDRQRIVDVKANFLKKYPNISEAAIDELFEKLTESGIKGVERNVTTKWTYGNAVLFTVTLLTTIGYGHLSPSTVVGKILCMVYTFLGIPITLSLLASYVESLKPLANSYKSNLFQRIGYESPVCVRLLHFSTISIFFVVGVFFLPAWVFYCLESAWSYLDSLYFCYISLTTIGLGDFVPAVALHHPSAEYYRIGVAVFLIIGVTIVMFMMDLAQDLWQNYNKGYHIIPVTIIPEKIPIKPDSPPCYGAVVVHVPETTDDKTILDP